MNPKSGIRNPEAVLRLAFGWFLLLAPGALSAENAPAPPPPASAPDYFPVVRGSEWVYATDLPQGDWLVQALYPDKIGGRDPHEHHHDGADAKKDEPREHLVFVRCIVPPGGRPVTLQKEWFRKDEDGDVLCGHRWIERQEVYLDPPQLYLPAAPAARKTWEWSGTVGYGATRVAASVEGEEAVQVPAGEFKALRVRVESTAGRGKGRAVRWFAPGVGLVQEEVEIDVKDGPPVKTWAKLKSFRIGPPAEK